MIGNVPLILEGCLRVYFRGLSFQSYRFFVPRKIVFGIGFMECFPVISNVSLDLGSRLGVYFRRFSSHLYRFFGPGNIVFVFRFMGRLPIVGNGFGSRKSSSCLVSWVVLSFISTPSPPKNRFPVYFHALSSHGS